MKCGGTDSFEHLMECMAVGPLPDISKEEEVVDFLVRLTWAAAEHAPLWPTAVNPVGGEVGACELLLEDWDTGSGQELEPQADDVFEDTLSFDRDPELCEQASLGAEGGS